MSDYELLRSKCAVVADATGLIWTTGDDSVVFLDSLLSQNIIAMAEGTMSRSLLLAPNGKLRARLWVLRAADRVGLLCDASRIDVVVADLSRFKIRVDVEIAAEERPVWDVWGSDAAVLAPAADLGWSDDGGELVADAPFVSSNLTRRIVAGPQPAAPVVDQATADAIRIEVGEPRDGIDFDDRTIPQEAGDVGEWVDFTKGCYLGQELVARIDSRGHVNRRLVGMIFDSETLPEVGAMVLYDGSEVGALTSVAWSDGMTAPIGLGLVKATVPSEAEVTADGRTGRIAAIPIKA